MSKIQGYSVYSDVNRATKFAVCGAGTRKCLSFLLEKLPNTIPLKLIQKLTISYPFTRGSELYLGLTIHLMSMQKDSNLFVTRKNWWLLGETFFLFGNHLQAVVRPGCPKVECTTPSTSGLALSITS